MIKTECSSHEKNDGHLRHSFYDDSPDVHSGIDQIFSCTQVARAVTRSSATHLKILRTVAVNPFQKLFQATNQWKGISKSFEIYDPAAVFLEV